jgi:hypothetical protein
MPEVEGMTTGMLEPGTSTGNVTLTPTPQAAPVDTTDWKSRFVGLQQANDKLRTAKGWESWDKVPSAAEVEQLRTQAKEIATLQGKLTEFETKTSAIAGELEIHKSQAARLTAFEQKVKLLAATAPDLVEFVDDIPTENDAEKQKAAITTFRERLQRYSGAKADPSRQGVPATPRTSLPLSSEVSTADLYGQMNRAMQASRDNPRDPALKAEADRLKGLWRDSRAQ